MAPVARAEERVAALTADDIAIALPRDQAAIAAAEARAVTNADDPTAVHGPARTRFVIGIDRSAQFQVFSLANPNRVIVELPDVRMQLPPATKGAIGLVKSFRGGVSAPGRTRVVIEVTHPVIVEAAKLEPAADHRSQRLVIDIVSVEPDRPKRAPSKGLFGLGALFPGSEPAAVATPPAADEVKPAMSVLQPPSPRPAMKPAERLQRTFKPTIVIDPGHGGTDSGAVKNGVKEKDVVLAFSLMLRDKLLATGRYNVLMTRSDDTFIPLDDRREFAERNKASLFIAVHADEGNSPARGATIYQLRPSVAADLKQSAKGGVASSLLTEAELKSLKQSSSGDVAAVKDILADYARHEIDMTQERTSVFTHTVTEYMSEATQFHGAPDRTAAFRVLKTQQLPAVLIELAFVSNSQDARLLQSDAWRNKVSDSIATAVESYFANGLAGTGPVPQVTAKSD